MANWWVQLLAVVASFAAPGDHDPLCSVLGGLDLARTRAIVTADPAALSRLYASPALMAADRRLVASYVERDLRLHGAILRRHSCRRVSRDGPTVRLAVVDSLGPTWVTTRAGERRMLPRDHASRHTVVLRRTGGGWRVLASHD